MAIIFPVLFIAENLPPWQINTMYPCGKIYFIHIAHYFQVIAYIIIAFYLFIYVYATSSVSSSSTSSLNAEEQSGTPSTFMMENNLQAT